MNRRVKLKSRDAAALKEFLQSLRSALGKNLLEAKLFGSKATGRDQPDSDIDVLVVVNRNGAEIEDRVVDIAFDVNLKLMSISHPGLLIAQSFPIRCGASLLFFRQLQKKGFLCEA